MLNPIIPEEMASSGNSAESCPPYRFILGECPPSRDPSEVQEYLERFAEKADIPFAHKGSFLEACMSQLFPDQRSLTTGVDVTSLPVILAVFMKHDAIELMIPPFYFK